MLNIKNLSVSLEGKKLLKDINVKVKQGERHLLQGANGSGKTTLAQTVAGNPDYKVDKGKITFEKRDITAMPVDERARVGIFLGAQHVPEIPGLSTTSFLKHSLNAHNSKMTAGGFFTALTAARERLSIPESWLGRSINVGFSGGERKRLMFLHLLLLKPKLAILDEPDSGTDAETQKLFADVIREMSCFPPPWGDSAARESGKGGGTGTTFLIISHQEGFTRMFSPTAITTLSGGEVMI